MIPKKLFPGTTPVLGHSYSNVIQQTLTVTWYSLCKWSKAQDHLNVTCPQISPYAELQCTSKD